MKIKSVKLAAMMVVLVGLCLPLRAAESKPLLIRLIYSKTKSFYLKVEGDQLRMAETKEGLDKAEPVKVTSSNASRGNAHKQFPKVKLPVPAGELAKKLGIGGKDKETPEDAVAMNVALVIMENPTGIFAIANTSVEAKWSKEPGKEDTWVYDWTVYGRGTARSTEIPVPLPDIKAPTLEIVAQPKSGGNVGIGLHFRSGNAQLSGIRKNGDVSKFSIVIETLQGKEVSRAEGNSDDFGFS
ncbi:MAG TPA: hypothetical protein PL033_18400 [Candidatus Brocadiia bacterium]|nr:hypothetical protein [Candidatus Brocadiia bacterium]